MSSVPDPSRKTPGERRRWFILGGAVLVLALLWIGAKILEPNAARSPEHPHEATVGESSPRRAGRSESWPVDGVKIIPVPYRNQFSQGTAVEIVDPEGKPVEQAVIYRVEDAERSVTAPDRLLARTDASGHAIVPPLESKVGEATLAWHPGFVPARLPALGREESIRLTLQRGASLRWLCRTRSGEPVSGVAALCCRGPLGKQTELAEAPAGVAAFPGNNPASSVVRTYSDASGELRVDGLQSAKYVVHLSHPFHVAISCKGTFVGEAVANPGTAEVITFARVFVVYAAFDRENYLSWNITSPLAGEIEDRMSRLNAESALFTIARRLERKHKGSATLALLAEDESVGELVQPAPVTIIPRSGRVERVMIPVRRLGDQIEPIEIRAAERRDLQASGEVSVVVQDPTGKPISLETLIITRVDNDFRYFAKMVPGEVMTLPAGRYSVRSNGAPFLDQAIASKEFVVAAGKPQVVTIQLNGAVVPVRFFVKDGGPDDVTANLILRNRDTGEAQRTWVTGGGTIWLPPGSKWTVESEMFRGPQSVTSLDVSPDPNPQKPQTCVFVLAWPEERLADAR